MALSLRDVKRSLTEQTIAEKAAALFKEHGFTQVSVRQIAKAAVVSEKTVFNYYPYKELIVLAGLQPALTEFMAEIQSQIDAITDPTEVLRHRSGRAVLGQPGEHGHRGGRVALGGRRASGAVWPLCA